MNITVKVEKKSVEVLIGDLAIGQYFVHCSRLFMKVEETIHPGSEGFSRAPRNAVSVELPSNGGGVAYHFPNEALYRVTPVDSVELTATY